MNNYWAFTPMRASNELLGNSDALQERMDEDGYLYLEGVLDTDKLTALRKDMLLAMAELGWVQRHPFLMKGIAIREAVREGDPDFLEASKALQRLESLHTLAHDDDLTSIMQQVLGPTAWPHPLKITRVGFPEHYEISTPPHQDYPNNQGTPNLTATWIPVGDCPPELGGIAVLRGSHKYGLLPLDVHLGAGNRCAVVPDSMLEELQWVTTDFSMGDVLLFPALTVHAALHNTTEFFMRLSVDFRFQTDGEELTPIVLEPHFQNLTWDDIYEDWKSDRYQRYWEDHEYQVVPFKTYELETTEVLLSDAQAEDSYLKRRRARTERRLERLAGGVIPSDEG